MIDSQVPDPTLPGREKRVIERLADNARQSRLIVIAARGLDIERHTNERNWTPRR